VNVRCPSFFFHSQGGDGKDVDDDDEENGNEGILHTLNAQHNTRRQTFLSSLASGVERVKGARGVDFLSQSKSVL